MTDIQVKVLAYDTVISRPMIKTLLNLDLLKGFSDAFCLGSIGINMDETKTDWKT